MSQWIQLKGRMNRHKTWRCSYYLSLYNYSQSYWHSHFSSNLLTVNPVYSITYSSLKLNAGRSLVAQWLRLCFHCRSTGSIADLGTKILCAIRHGQKKRKETRINNKNYTLRMFTLSGRNCYFQTGRLLSLETQKTTFSPIFIYSQVWLCRPLYS